MSGKYNRSFNGEIRSGSKNGARRSNRHRRTNSTTSRISRSLDRRISKRFPFRAPLCCKQFSLPSWRFSHRFEWRSQTKYEGRFIPLAGSDWSKEQVTQRSNVDTEKLETSFINNRTHTSKYTLLTFFPMNLFEQFRRGANIYFLTTLILTVILPDSPISPMSWLMSLMFVIAVTMAKQGYEDYLRHQSDREANERKIRVLRDGDMFEIESQYVQVGDIVHLRDDELVPCDLVVLSTSQETGQCYVMTANLDGETNLKTRFAANLTKSRRTREGLANFIGYIECENPNPKLENFLGRLSSLPDFNQAESETCSLGHDNVLLAGTVLKNSREMFGVCVYSGTQTKMSLNSKITRIKFSTIEKSLNKFLLWFIVLLLTEMAVSTLCSMLLGIEYSSSTAEYIGEVFPKNFKIGIEVFLIWLVLYNYIIPISMYVTIELQKFLASMFIPWDAILYDEERDIPAKCNTSDINEELGLVTHLFTDKTGTLTRNIMVFQQYSRNGEIFRREDLENEPWNEMMMVLTLCHSVQVSGENFVASSPDEKALLDACMQSGFRFAGENLSGEMTVEIPSASLSDNSNNDSTTLKFQKLAELEFDSFRKCMTVIVRDLESNQIHLLSKGAEMALLPVCTSGMVEETEKAVDMFAAEGLRTLVLAHKLLTEEEMESFDRDLETAKQSLVNRTKYVREVYKKMESDLKVIGCTAIEDRLQDKVVETITKIKMAGIIPWMLTGDKKETALNLANAAGLLPQPNKLIDICDMLERDTGTILDQIQSEMRIKYFGKSASIVVDGKSITSIMKCEELCQTFLEICEDSCTVIACRLSPIQKSQLVRMMKEADVKNTTAAIGDGGNDISMIQEAHVGLGLVGQEGTAAAKAADFAFSKFCHLQRILLVHGHWYYRRLSFLVQYSFYKNVACFTCQVFFAIDSNWSGQTLFDSWFLFMYNTLYTMFPVLVYGLTEQNQGEVALMSNPKLYKIHRGNILMTKRMMVKWIVLGVWHAAVCYYGWRFLWKSYFQFVEDMFEMGSLVAFTSVIVINLKVLVESRHWNVLLVTSVILSVLSYVLFTVLYDQWYMDNFLFANPLQFRTFQQTIKLLPTWITIMLLTVISLLPDVLYHLFKPFKKKAKKFKFRFKRNKKTYPLF